MVGSLIRVQRLVSTLGGECLAARFAVLPAVARREANGESALITPFVLQKHAAELSPQEKRGKALWPCLFKPCLLLDTSGFAAVRLSRYHSRNGSVRSRI